MRFSLLENGIDSLRQANVNIDENYLDHEFESFQLKDGLFNFVHGVEILAKYLISNNNEEDIMIDKQKYRNAKKEMKDHHKSVFDVKPGLNTISARDAVRLLRRKFQMENDLCIDVLELINIRDSLMHYTVEMDKRRKDHFVKKLRDSMGLVSSYFSKKIPEFNKIFERLERNYPYTEYDRWEDEAIAASEANYEEGRLGI